MTCLSFFHLKTETLNSLTDKQTYWGGIGLEALVATTQTVSWIVALVYWIILSKELPSKNNTLRSLNVIEHSIDLIFVLMEIFLTKSWLNYSAVLFPLAVAWLYTFWTWIFVYAKVL